MMLKGSRRSAASRISVNALTCAALLLASGTAPVIGQQTVYSTQFQTGLDPKLMVQAPRPDSITLVSAAQGKVIKVTINKNDDYSRVANGVPRAEIGFGQVCRFVRGKEYLIRWSVMIPPDFEFDSQQPEGLTQIHGGAPKGSPPFGLLLDGSNYAVRVQGRPGNTNIGAAASDKGKWVQWSLRYRPDENGGGAVTELYKNNKIIFNANGTANAFPNDDAAYLKVGVYKWWWQSRPSAVSVRTVYFGDVQIAQR